MIKSLISFLTASTLLIPAVASSQEVAHTTDFVLMSRVGEVVTRYSLTDSKRVVMPAGLPWQCVSVPVSLSSDGSVYSAGFICKSSNNDLVSVESNCYSSKPDQEKNSVQLTTSADDTGSIKFTVMCATVSNEDTGTRYRQTSTR